MRETSSLPNPPTLLFVLGHKHHKKMFEALFFLYVVVIVGKLGTVDSHLAAKQSGKRREEGEGDGRQG